MLGIIKKMFIVLLTSIVNSSSLVNAFGHTKFVSLSNQKCNMQPTLINLHPNEYSQEPHYHSFVVKVDKCVGSCNTLNHLSNRVCVPPPPSPPKKKKNKTEDLSIHVFNMITGKN